MQIRMLAPEEAELFHAFRLRGLRESPAAFGKTYEEDAALSPEQVRGRFSSSPEAFVLGALDEQGALLGVAGFFRERPVKYRHKGVLWGMYVAPEARGQGVGRELLAAVVERARALAGLEQIMLDVVTAMEPARRLYRALGFQVYGLERRAMRQGDSFYDVEHMVLYLEEQSW